MNIDSQKEADGFITLKEREYPLIVMESGWGETPRDLIADSQLWLWGTKPPMEFVFVVEHVESKAQIQEKNRDPEQSLSNGEPICDPDDRYYADDDNAERRSTSKRLDETTSAASR
jgi:hypothetical protein